VHDLERATEWARRGLPYSGGFNPMGESEFLAGKVAFMRGDLGEALRYFKLVKKTSGVRLFKEEDPRFRKLLDEGVG